MPSGYIIQRRRAMFYKANGANVPNGELLAGTGFVCVFAGFRGLT